MSETLYKLQTEFLEFLINSPTTSDVGEFPEALLSKLNETKVYNRKQRLQTYARSYFWRLNSFLEYDFPCLRKILGEKVFDELSVDFYRLHPPRSYKILEINFSFPDFFREHPLAREQSLLIELVDFEFLLSIYPYKKQKKQSQEEVLDYLQKTNIDEVFLGLNGGSQIFSASYPVHLLYEDKLDQASVKKEITKYLIYSWEGKSFYQILTNWEYEILSLVGSDIKDRESKKTLQEILESVTQKYELSSEEIQSSFANFMQKSIFSIG